MKTILVTGGCGFIGSHFVRLMLRETEWRAINLDKLTYAGDPERLADVSEGERYRFVHGDIGDRTLVDTVLAEEHPWAVVNFAAESHVDRSILDASTFVRTNVAGVQTLIDACRQHHVVRLVQISTDEVYGDLEGTDAAAEDSPLRPSSPYAASKAAADLLCLAARRTYRLPVVIVRSANNYGPFQYPEKLIPLMIRNALGGEDLPLYGDGQQVRDWLHVQDNCEAILRIVQKGAVGAIYNVSAGQLETNASVVRSVCHLLAEEAGLDAGDLLGRIRHVPDRPGHDRRYAMRSDLIRRHLAWAPRTPIDEGLRQTVRWYLQNRDWIARVTTGTHRAYYDAVHGKSWDRG